MGSVVHPCYFSCGVDYVGILTRIDLVDVNQYDMW